MVQPRPSAAAFAECAAYYYQFNDGKAKGPYHPDPCNGSFRYMCDFWRDRTPTLGLGMGLSEIAMLAEFHALSGL
jgi:hypothetical protein